MLGSTGRMNTFFDALADVGIGTWQFDITTHYLTWDRTMCDIYACDPNVSDQKNVFKYWLSTIVPSDLAEMKRIYLEDLQSTQQLEYIHKIKTATGDVRFILSKASVHKNNADEPILLLGSSIDVTKYNLIDQSLRDTQERLLLAKKAAQIGIWELELGSNKLLWDDDMFDIFGLDENVFTGHYDDWEKLVHPDDINDAVNDFQLSIKERKPFDSEFRIIRPDGEVRYIFAKAQVILNDIGEAEKCIGVNIDVSEKKETESQVKFLAYHDSLTNLPNRTLAIDRLNQSIAKSARDGLYYSLVFIDIDNFKYINDTLGHNIGDAVLKEISKRLQQSIRAQDTVARLGGDEFLVIISALDPTIEAGTVITTHIIEKLQQAIHQPIEAEQHLIDSSASIGITIFKGNKYSAKTLMQQADMAMYNAKESHKGTYHFFNEYMREKMIKHLALEESIKSAIKEDQFALHFQPKYNSNNRLTGAEALVRWLHPTQGTLFPGDFISTVEGCPLIFELGYWVIESACQQIVDWQIYDHLSSCHISVNISAKQFGEQAFTDKVKDIVNKYRIPENSLIFEITESLLLDDIEFTINQLIELSKLGIQFSIDDFGTGYSSLAYLKRLPIHEIKIDKSFIHNIENDRADEMIVRTIINLADNFQLSVIAEGVEKKAQVKKLKELGCHQFQGYFFSKPLSNEDFIAFTKVFLNQQTLGNELDAKNDVFLGIASRRYIFSQLAYWLKQNPTKHYTVLVCEVHQFKGINDGYGIHYGDKLIEAISKRLIKTSPSNALIGRMGGDGFAILLPPEHAELDSAEALAIETIEMLQRPFSIKGSVVVLKASIGIASYPIHGENASDVIHAADIALHSLSENTAQRVAKFDPRNYISTKQRYQIENDLRYSIVNEKPNLVLGERSEQFQVLYQPLISLSQKKIVGVESLLRWRHPDRGYIKTERLITAAENIGEIYLLGLWVIKMAIADFSHPSLQSLPLSINISTRQLDHVDQFISDVTQVAENTGRRCENVRLELAETAAIQTYKHALNKLKSIGFGLALDDFGTGYSSLNVLKNMPFDYAKLDNSFIQNLFRENSANEDGNVGVVNAFYSLCHELNIKTIAEGVETQQQAQYMRDLGINECQGYFYTEPLPFDQFLDFYDQFNR